MMPWSWSKQWILNQFERRPYLEPLLDMPTEKHFFNLHDLHEVLFFLLMTHWFPVLHSPMDDLLLYVRPKKDLQPSQVKAPKW